MFSEADCACQTLLDMHVLKVLLSSGAIEPGGAWSCGRSFRSSIHAIHLACSVHK